MSQPKVALLGKLPPPYMGPAIATRILLDSKLGERYELIHVDTNVHGSLDTLGAWRLDKVWKNLGVYRRFACVLYRERPALVLVPISQATLGFLKDSVFVLLSRLFGRRTLVQLRGSNIQNWLAEASAPTRAYAEAVLRVASGAIVLGSNLRHLFAKYFPEDRIYVVPNGANYAIAREAPQGGAVQGSGAVREGGAVRVLYLANLQPSKGIGDVVRAAKLLAERGVRGFTLDVVGAWRDARTKQACLRLAEVHALPVTFHGPAYGADKFAFMAQADCFAFTPREPEGHPWVIVEALAAGLPIVSTDQGAITESVQDGKNGFIVAPRCPQEIAARLQQLIELPALRARQAAASRAHYEAHFTEERMVERLSTAFEHALQAA